MRTSVHYLVLLPKIRQTSEYLWSESVIDIINRVYLSTASVVSGFLNLQNVLHGLVFTKQLLLSNYQKMKCMCNKQYGCIHKQISAPVWSSCSSVCALLGLKVKHQFAPIHLEENG